MSTAVRRRVTPGEIAHLLSLGKRGLDRRASLDITLYFLAAPIRVAFLRVPLKVVRRAWETYRKTKRSVQKGGGWVLARALGPVGGRRVCVRTNFCKKKGEIQKLWDEFGESPEVVDVATDNIEALGLLAEIVEEVIEEIGDSVFPVSFTLRTVFYGLEDLCKCCPDCNGTGDNEGKVCERCGGTGVLA